MWSSIVMRSVNLNRDREVKQVRHFLSGFNLSFDAAVDYTVALYHEDNIVATGSLAGEVLRNFAVDESMQGAGLTATVISELMREAAQRGVFHYFIFTRPTKSHLFAALGFAEIARAEPYAAVLEAGMGSIDDYCSALRKQTANFTDGAAAIVMNANPFTRGHLALVEQAAAKHNVIVFVVEEDKSVFPFTDRLRLIREGTAHLQNVAVVPGGKYIISAATFPAYFTREEEVLTAQTALDISVFATRIAPALSITHRYIGEEPYCAVTAAYNRAMLEILPKHGIEPVLIPRIEDNNTAISASAVREALRADDWTRVETLVPLTTYRYLKSSAALPSIELIRSGERRH